MLFDNVLHYRQSQTSTISFGRVVRRKNGLQLFRRNPLPAIGHHDFNAIAAAFTRFNRNRALTDYCMNGVQIKIQQNLGEPIGIGLNGRQRGIGRKS